MLLSVQTAAPTSVATNNSIRTGPQVLPGTSAKRTFMQSIKPVLNRLTLRLATGFTGNISRAVSPQLIINLLDDYRNVANNVYHIGSISSPPNPNLRWEKTKDMKVALDFGLFNDRLTGIIEGYYRKTTDMVTSVRVLTTTGYSKTTI